MALSKLQFRPGVNREVTSYTNEGGWFDIDNVRFQKGFPEKIGGWQKSSSNSFLGTCRALHPWVSLDRDQYIGVGTNLKYYIDEGGFYNDITPIRLTTSAGDACCCGHLPWGCSKRFRYFYWRCFFGWSHHGRGNKPRVPNYRGR